MTLETTRRCYRVDRRQISFIKFILEAYDNVAVLSTLDPRLAVIQVTAAPGCEALVDGILRSLADEIDFAPFDDASSIGALDETNRLPSLKKRLAGS